MELRKIETKWKMKRGKKETSESLQLYLNLMVANRKENRRLNKNI